MVVYIFYRMPIIAKTTNYNNISSAIYSSEHKILLVVWQ